MVILCVSTAPAPPTCYGTWTRFFDRDDAGGSGDYETLNNLRSENPGKICSNPSAVEARDVATNQPYQNSGQVVTVSTTVGFRCVNGLQPNRTPCKDYKVRFCCPRVTSKLMSSSSCVCK